MLVDDKEIEMLMGGCVSALVVLDGEVLKGGERWQRWEV